MSRTVVGIFKEEAEAKEAITALHHNGFNEEQVDCSTAKIPSMSAETRTQNRENHTEEDNAVVRFFKSLFNDDDEHVHKFSRAARGRTIITVHTNDEAAAAEAVEILED